MKKRVDEKISLGRDIPKTSYEQVKGSILYNKRRPGFDGRGAVLRLTQTRGLCCLRVVGKVPTYFVDACLD